MVDPNDALRRLTEYLRSVTSPRHQAVRIDEDTEIYKDLGIYGDDLVELVWWLEKKFGVTTNVDPFIYAPGDALPFGFLRAILSFGRPTKPQYKSLKVRDLLAAIEAKRWPDEDAD